MPSFLDISDMPLQLKTLHCSNFPAWTDKPLSCNGLHHSYPSSSLLSRSCILPFHINQLKNMHHPSFCIIFMSACILNNLIKLLSILNTFPKYLRLQSCYCIGSMKLLWFQTNLAVFQAFCCRYLSNPLVCWVIDRDMRDIKQLIDFIMNIVRMLREVVLLLLPLSWLIWSVMLMIFLAFHSNRIPIHWF